jgi:hypothetical protein
MILHRACELSERILESRRRLVGTAGRSALRVALVTGSFVAIAMVTASGQATVSLTSATCPVCSAQRAAASEARLRLSMGVVGRDVLGHEIGTFTAGGKWRPIADTKQTVCGELKQFKWYYDIDDDWAFNIVPYGPYQAMLNAAIAAGGEAVCGGTCVHSEINMDQAFPNDDFFKLAYYIPATHVMKADDVIGKDMCVYGPWVSDIAKNHGDKPEIHPAELVWWLDRNLTPLQRSLELSLHGISVNTLHVMMLQDDRNSFDRPENFNFPVACTEFPFIGQLCAFLPGSPRPWAMVPRRAEIRLEFATTSDGAKPLSYAITERYSRHVTTADDATARQDQGSGTVYSIEMDGVPVVQVQELQPDDHLGVLLDSICVVPQRSITRWIFAEKRFRTVVTPARLLGQIVLNSQFGLNDRGKEGFQVLDILRAESDPASKRRQERLLALHQTLMQAINDTIRDVVGTIPHVRLSPVRAVRYAMVAPHRTESGELVGDIAITESDGAAPALVRAEVYRGGRMTPIVPNPPAGASSTRVRDTTILVRSVPSVGVDSAVLRFGDGGSVRIPVPAIGLAPLRREIARTALPAPGEWRTISAVAGVNGGPSRAPGEVVATPDWSIEFVPEYAALDDDGVAEEGTPFTTALNQMVVAALAGKDTTALARVFGTAAPFSVTWSFVGTNETSGRRVTVRIGQQAAAGEIAVRLAQGGPVLGYGASFPSGRGAVYRLDAVGKFLDAFGVKGEVRNTTWSHYVKVTTPDSTVEAAIVSMAGGDLAQWKGFLSAKGLLQDLESESARHHAYGRQLRASTRQATSDGRLTPDELGRLIRLVKGESRQKQKSNGTARRRE